MDLQNKKSIDVVIPVYNGEKFVTEAIRSILAQDLKPDHIIVVSDGSTDRTSEIILKLSKESPVKITLIEQENKGISAARNAGIMAGTSDYVAFLDHDDIWFKDKLSSQLKIFSESDVENLGLVYCPYINIDQSGREISDAKIYPIDISNKGLNLLKKNLDKNIIMSSGSGVLIKRECFKKVGLFDQRLSAFEDWDMWLRIMREYGVSYTEKTLVGIRIHGSNMQKNFKHMLHNHLIFYRKWFTTALLNRPDVLHLWFIRLMRSFMKYMKSHKIQQPKVSVIMPVYNGERYIVQTLESLIVQSNFIKELIIINDSSTDNTCAIVEKFIHEKDEQKIIKILNNKFEKGIAGSRNTGLEASTGEYIAQADSDDLYTKNRLKEQIKFLDNHKKIDVLGSSFVVFGKNTKTKKIYRPIFSILTAFFMVGDISLCHPSVMFRRSILQTFKKYPDVKVEDFAFFSKVLKKHRAINTLRSFIQYRRHENSYSIDLTNFSLVNSSKETFHENYAYYVNDIKDRDILSDFLRKRKVSIVNIRIVLKTSSLILKKIREDYRIRYYDFDFIFSLLYIYILVIIYILKFKE